MTSTTLRKQNPRVSSMSCGPTGGFGPFDLIVIGGGSGGVVTAIRAARDHGARVALIEKHTAELGGTCVHAGCVPKKLMFNATLILEQCQHAYPYGVCGIDPSQVCVDWKLLVEARDGYSRHLGGVYKSKLSTAGVTVIEGEASFKDAHSVHVQVPGGSNPISLSAPHIAIATGSSPRMLRVPGSQWLLTSDDAVGARSGSWNVASCRVLEAPRPVLDSVPRSLAILGGGYIACELAGIFSAMGTNVTMIIRRQDGILSAFDSMIRDRLRKAMVQQAGITVIEAVITAVQQVDSSPDLAQCMACGCDGGSSGVGGSDAQQRQQQPPPGHQYVVWGRRQQLLPGGDGRAAGGGAVSETSRPAGSTNAPAAGAALPPPSGSVHRNCTCGCVTASHAYHFEGQGDTAHEGPCACAPCEPLPLAPAVDAVVCAVGRVPNTSSLHLDAAGIKVDDATGAITTDEYQNTSTDGCYAVGDATGRWQLTPVAIAAGRLLADRLFGRKKRKTVEPATTAAAMGAGTGQPSQQQSSTPVQAPLPPRVVYSPLHIPTVVFSHPPIAVVGLTEQQAIHAYGRQGVRCYVTSFAPLLYALVQDPKPQTTMKMVCRRAGVGTDAACDSTTGGNHRAAGAACHRDAAAGPGYNAHTCAVEDTDDNPSSDVVVGLHVIGPGAEEMIQGFAVAVAAGLTKGHFDATMAVHPTSAEEVVTMPPWKPREIDA